MNYTEKQVLKNLLKSLTGSLGLTTVLFFMVEACAHTWVRDQMQPDDSYKIETFGNGFASITDAKIMAVNHAYGLCGTKGYDTTGEVPYDGFKPSYTLIVKCKK